MNKKFVFTFLCFSLNLANSTKSIAENNLPTLKNILQEENVEENAKQETEEQENNQIETQNKNEEEQVKENEQQTKNTIVLDLSDKGVLKVSTEQNEEQQTNNEDQEKINKNLQTKINKKKKIEDKDMGKLLTIFDFKKALNYNYNKIKYSNAEFLENASEFKIIKQVIKLQNDPEEQRKLLQEEARKKSLAEAIKKGEVEQPFNGIHLTSLLFFDSSEWICRIDGKTIKSDDRNKRGNKFSIVKVNKTSIVFVLKKTTKTMIKQVENLVEKQYPYYQNYFLTEENGKQYIGFKLFVGQKIDFDTMRISG